MITKRDIVLNFIRRRFSIDCNWTSGNCYYFALILKDRFPEATIYYDPVSGHFFVSIDGKYFDWTGEIKAPYVFVKWDAFDLYDAKQKERIIRDCIL
jgi:hypothetical protein